MILVKQEVLELLHVRLALVCLAVFASSVKSVGSIAAAASLLEVATPPNANCDCYQNDTCTLLTFKKSLQHEGEPILGSWSNSNLTRWRGVTWQQTSGGAYFVEKLELGGLQLGSGGAKIFPLLQKGLTSLVVLNISSNNFAGQLPKKLQVCPALQVLDLSNNSFAGALPQEFCCGNRGQESTPLNLRSINVSLNNFTGEVPSSLFLKSSTGLDQSNASCHANLSSIVLESNQLYGTIPYSLGKCASLVDLKLAHNYFNGSVPFGELGMLRKLETLDISYNDISGPLTLPTENGSFEQLTSLSLSYNVLEGRIPEILGNLSNLEFLTLDNNSFTGPMPGSLGKLSKLQILLLSFNNVSGKIPEEFSQLQNLRILKVDHNLLTGSMLPIFNCTKLRKLWIGSNRFFYPGAPHLGIPPQLTNLTDLVALSIFGSHAQGNIPSELDRLKNLAYVDFSFNKLSGEIPPQLCTLHQMQALFLNSNDLTGSIPECFGNFSHMRLLSLFRNRLSGELPHDLANLSRFANYNAEQKPELMDVTWTDWKGVWPFYKLPLLVLVMENNLSGEIPSSLGENSKLQQLYLSHNSFSGQIPSSFGKLSSLLLLDLSYNQLQGKIPDELANLTFLTDLNLSYNDLRGQIPEQGQFATFQASSFLGNAGLCGKVLGNVCAANMPMASPHYQDDDDESIFYLPALLIGAAVGFFVTWVTFIFSARVRRWFFTFVGLSVLGKKPLSRYSFILPIYD